MPYPTIAQRLIACERPTNRHHIMYQKWRDLLFLHWEYDPALIQKTLPQGLYVDTYDQKAYLGLVPFLMRDIRPRFCPTVPGISNFLEMNLRTYVFDEDGRPGVWFYSLDANQFLAVRTARTFFNLPYFDAQMEVRKDRMIDYKVLRKGYSMDFESHIRYSKLDNLPGLNPESLEFFLIERYYLFAINRGGTLFSGKVQHQPYPLSRVNVEVLSCGAVAQAGFEKPDRQPDHAIMSEGVDVDIFAIEKIDCATG